LLESNSRELRIERMRMRETREVDPKMNYGLLKNNLY